MADDDGWTTVTSKPRKPKAPQASSSSSSNPYIPQRKAPSTSPSVQVATQKKYNAGTNKQRAPTRDLRKIENEEENLHHERVGVAFGQRVQQARAAKNWTQKDLAVQISEKPNVVQEYENGSAIPDTKIILKMEKALGVKLPRNK
eukprot:TRINITY_DN13354_c1_g1_i1.p1 TRINITY_DN13354_c1_g1~~TRINITY_DN13354_c1_g1_i1.p1  ORF type:complete len:145 (+),score=37.03 TRINITY_DN13354_c1_g1_i1:127-561(+)